MVSGSSISLVEAQERAARALGPMGGLEALPQAVHRALNCIADSRSTSAELAAILSTDQALAGRLLGMANSVLYRGSHRFVTVREAVVRLGYRRTQDLLLAAAFSSCLQRPLRLYNLASGELWYHSLTTAVAARLVAESIITFEHEGAYLAGLLHDAGRVVLARSLPRPDALAVAHAVRYGSTSFHEAERRVLGFTHADAGAVLLRRWNLDEELVQAVAGHHYGVAEAGPLAWAVHVADVLAVMASPPSSTKGWLLSVDPTVAEQVQLQRWLEDQYATGLDGFLDEIRWGVGAAARLIEQNGSLRARRCCAKSQ